MEVSMDLQVRAFKNSIVEFMNKSPLATEIKRLVLSEILQETTKLVDNDIRVQIKSLQETKENSDEAKMAASDKSNTENSPE